MSRLAVLLAVMMFPGILLQGQDDAWQKVPDPASSVTVMMPKLPHYKEVNLYTEGQAQAKLVFSCETGPLELVFESIPLGGTDKRAVSSAMKRTIDLAALKYGGKPGKADKLTRDGIEHRYVEVEMATGAVLRSVMFTQGTRLLHLYAAGPKSKVYGLDANRYLQSWYAEETKAGEQPGGEEESETIPRVQQDEDPMNDWVAVEVNGSILAEFPDRPFRRTTVVDMGRRDITVTAYSRFSDAFSINFVLTYRIYGEEEAQLEDEALFDHMAGQMVEHNRVKLIRESEVSTAGSTAYEYLFSRGIRFYRLQLFRIDGTVYQAMAKCKRRTMERPEIDYFFNSLRPQN